MTEPMSDERLAEIRAEIDNQTWWQGSVKRAARDVLELLAEVGRRRAELDKAATLLGHHLSSEECWLNEEGSCIRHGSSRGEPCRMPQTRELLKRIHVIKPHPHSAAVGCIYPGCENPNHKPRTRDYRAGG